MKQFSFVLAVFFSAAIFISAADASAVAVAPGLAKRSADPEPILDGIMLSAPLVATLGIKGLALLGKAQIEAVRSMGKRSAELAKRSAEPEPFLDGLMLSAPLVATLGIKGLALLGSAQINAVRSLGKRSAELEKRSAEPAPVEMGTAALLGAIGLVALKTLGLVQVAGAVRNGKRSVDYAGDFVATLQDDDDCVKKTVCHINALPDAELTDAMLQVKRIFAVDGQLDYARHTVEFDVAALLGRNGGDAQCEVVYSQCRYGMDKLFELAQAA